MGESPVTALMEKPPPVGDAPSPGAVPVPKHSLNEDHRSWFKTKDLTKIISDASFTSDMLIFV